jgi:hypothetical protein
VSRRYGSPGNPDQDDRRLTGAVVADEKIDDSNSGSLARAVARASVMKAALNLLTEISTPLSVRLGLRTGLCTLTTQGDGWWATVATTAEVDEIQGEVSACVPRMAFHEAVDAELFLFPDPTCSLTVVADDVVRYGNFAFAGSQPSAEPPPVLGSPIAVVTIVDAANGRVSLPDHRWLEIPSKSVERFLAREIETADVMETDSEPYLVGRQPAAGGLVLVLIARGRWVTDDAEVDHR